MKKYLWLVSIVLANGAFAQTPDLKCDSLQQVGILGTNQGYIGGNGCSSPSGAFASTSEVDAKVGTVSTALQNGLSAVDTQIAQTNVRIDTTNTRVGGLENRFSSFENATNARFGSLESRLTQYNRSANRGIAGVGAINQIILDPNKTFGIGIGVGHYRGETEFGVGVAGRLNQNLSVRGGYSTSGVSSASATYQW